MQAAIAAEVQVQMLPCEATRDFLPCTVVSPTTLLLLYQVIPSLHLQEKAQAAMKQLDVDEVLSNATSSTSPAEPETGGTANNGAAPQHAVQSPVAAAAVRDGAMQFREMQKRAQRFRGKSSGGDVGSVAPGGHTQKGSSRDGYSEPK